MKPWCSLLKLVILAVLLAGCASLPDDEPAVCDGRHRRPANPYGSILDASSPAQIDASALATEPGSQPNNGQGGCL